MTVSLHNRRKLEVAMRGLLDGTVTPPDTKLTWKNVAAVAGISKATADRAIDLRQEFRRQIEERVPPPTTRRQPRSRSRGDADEEVARLRREHADLRESTKVLHSVILALTQENHRLAHRRRRDDGNGVPLTAPTSRRRRRADGQSRRLSLSTGRSWLISKRPAAVTGVWGETDFGP